MSDVIVSDLRGISSSYHKKIIRIYYDFPSISSEKYEFQIRMGSHEISHVRFLYYFLLKPDTVSASLKETRTKHA